MPSTVILIIPILVLVMTAVISHSCYRRVVFYSKIAASGVITMVASTLGCFSSIYLYAIGKRSNINQCVARIFYALASRVLGIDVDIIGEEHLVHLQVDDFKQRTPCIIVANHQSSLDLLPMGKLFPKYCVILAKASLRFVPMLGMFMTLGNAIFINRKDRTKALHSMSVAAEKVKKEKLSVFIFPEGTRARLQNLELLPFKKGAFHLAVEAGVPILPVVFQSFDQLYDKKREFLDSGKIIVKVLPPISTTGMTVDNVTELTEKTRELMLKTLKEISAPVKKDETKKKVDNDCNKDILEMEPVKEFSMDSEIRKRDVKVR